VHEESERGHRSAGGDVVNDRGRRHDDCDALAAGWALSALEPEDELLFLGHLPTCQVCERAVATHRDTLAHLAWAVSAEAPPASLLLGIRSAVATRPREVEPLAPLRLDLRRPGRQARSARLFSALVGAAAAVIALAVVLAVGHGSSLQERQAQLAADRLGSTVASLLVPGARKVDLEGAGGRGAVIVTGHTVSLVMSGVAPNDARTSIYVLWEKTTFGDVRAVGAFDVSSPRVSVINDLHLASADTVKTFMVTRESGRTVPVRTIQSPVLAGDA
jgi:hypothetical protein